MNRKNGLRMMAVSMLALFCLLLLAACNKKEEQPANTMSQEATPAPSARRLAQRIRRRRARPRLP